MSARGTIRRASFVDDLVGQTDRHVDSEDARPLRSVEQILDLGETSGTDMVGRVEIEQHAGPGAAASVETGDPARHG